MSDEPHFRLVLTRKDGSTFQAESEGDTWAELFRRFAAWKSAHEQTEGLRSFWSDACVDGRCGGWTGRRGAAGWDVCRHECHDIAAQVQAGLDVERERRER